MPAPLSRVLVVDDDEAFANMVADVLREAGHEAMTSNNSVAAAELVKAGHFDAVVVDLVMPGLNGFELAERVHASSPDTQVVVLTGHGHLDSAIEGIRRGVFDYLQKSSIDIPRLQRTVAAAAGRAQLQRENRTLVQQLREGNHRLTVLHGTTAAISEEAHSDRLLLELVSAAKTLCHAERGRAILFDRTTDRLVVEIARGDDTGSLAGVRLPAGEGIIVRAFDQRTALISAAPRQEASFSERTDVMSTDKPGLVVAPLQHGRVRGVVMVAGRQEGAFGDADREVLAIVARHAAVALDNALEHESAINFFTHTSDLLVSLLDRLDIHYEGHSRSAAHLADMITRRLGISDLQRRNVHFAALLHDIGKLLIPAEILQAKTFAKDADRKLLQQHPALAVELLKPIAAWAEILPMIHSHHERWDGKGYPLGTAGEDIPLGGRVIAVAEAFDAMTRKRAHGPTRTPEAALAELEAFAGSQFDPKIVRLFVAEYRQSEM